MLPVFIELTFSNEKGKTIVNVNNIEAIEERRYANETRDIYSTIVHSSGRILSIKETPDEIKEKIVRAREKASIDLMIRLHGMGLLSGR